ncbi:S-adenosyl-L-methionine-dependent methyltransferase, partial [Apiosordaria backusii]
MPDDANKTKGYHHLRPSYFSSQQYDAQLEYRHNLLKDHLPERPTRVLEIGCGQGTTTDALARLVLSHSPHGHIDALDPAPLSQVFSLEKHTYQSDGCSPFTLGQAQAYLTSPGYGFPELITFHQADPVQFLLAEDERNKNKKWDVAVLVHSVWYFRDVDSLAEILQSLKGRVKRVLIAEFALHATVKEALPHVFAAIARGTLEGLKLERGVESSTENMRCLVSPEGIKQVARETGWKLEREGVVVPEIELGDGDWETNSVVGEGFEREIE